MKKELPEDIYQQILDLSKNGDDLAKQGEYKAAIASYSQAWEKVPEPKEEWNTSTWILAAIADSCFYGKFYNSAREALEFALTGLHEVGNPFFHLRYGQVLFEQGEMDASANELLKAYIAKGEDIFAAEDVKYFDFLKTRAIV